MVKQDKNKGEKMTYLQRNAKRRKQNKLYPFMTNGSFGMRRGHPTRGKLLWFCGYAPPDAPEEVNRIAPYLLYSAESKNTTIH